MLTAEDKEIFKKLDTPYPAIAIKYLYNQPEDIPHYDGMQRSLCSFIRQAQIRNAPFYITEDDECCMGRYVLGMMEAPGFEASGSLGRELGIFCSPAPNARLYHQAAKLTKGAHRFVAFSPIEMCSFDPDLVVLVCGVESYDIIMRANSWFSGDLWESVDTPVMGCSWMFAYPYITGKINHSITGTHMGQKTLRPYPAGLHMISIPYQKLREVLAALRELPWVIEQPEGDPDELERQKVKRHQH